jgi:hypothetical protein
LIHLRLRPEGGLDLGRFVRAEGTAAKLYGLRNELFLATTLEGVWEAALYPPAGDPPFPGLALALDLHDRERGRTAVDGFLRELGESWPVRRVPHSQGPWRGECLANLKVMPDLEPCYVVTDDALVVGWNRRSLGLALRPTEKTADASSATVYLSRFPEIDAEIERLAGVERPVPLLYPWRRLELRGGTDRGVQRLRFRLVDSEEGR